MAEDRRTGPRENTSPETDAVSLPQYDMFQNDIGLPDEDNLGGFSAASPDSTQTLDPDLYDESPPTYEDALTRMEGFVREEFGEDVARAVTRPNQAMDALPDGLDLNEVYQAVEPMLAEDADAMMAGEQYRTQWKNMGRNPDELDNTMLRQMAAFWGEQATGTVGDAAAGMAEARSRWGKLKDTIVDVGVSVFTSPDFNVGLQTLDFFTWANKKFKLAFVPREERAEIEQRVLPRVTLEDGTEYTMATGFAIQQIGQNLLAGAEGIGGGLVETIGGWVGSETMEDIGRRTRERGGQRRETYEDRVQEAASLMGDHLTWIQVGEMRDPGMVVDIARGLSNISLEPARPGLAAPEGASGNQIPDDVWNRVRDEVREADSIDPFLAEMYLQGEVGYGVLGALAFGDALMEIAFDPTVIAGEAAPKVLPAIRAGVKAADPARAARITSKVARDTERLEDTADAINAARAHVKRTQEQATVEIRRTGSVSKESRDKIVLAQRQLANEEAYLGRAKDPGPNDVVIPYSRRTHPDLAEMDMRTTESYVDEMPVLNRKTGEVEEVEVKGTITRPKTVNEVAAELHETRVRELGRSADYVLPDQTGGLPLFESARVLGADDIEQAGDALNHAVRTGGVGINDVWLHSPVPHHNITPDTNFGLIDWKALDRANDVTRAERQFMATSGATQFELGYSVRRSLHRQKAIVDKNYGMARQSGDKARIKVYEKQKENIENAIRAVKDDDALRAADKKFDERWRPGVTDKPMGNPESFHRRLQTFGDQLFETAYPGGWAIRGLQRSKLGQMFIPFREPQRFFETFRPQVWDEMQGGYIRYQSNNRAWHEGLRVGAEKSGIYRPRSKWDPRRAASRYEVDEAKNELLFDLLDTDPDGNPERFAELAAQADDALMKFHDDIRRQLDYYADLQGVGRGPGSPRYLRGYMRHTVTPDQFAGGARPIEYIGVPRNADIFTSHLMHRKGTANYRKDALAVLDLYGRAANRKRHIEPLFDSILRNGQEMSDEFSNPLMLQYANDLVSELSGKPTPFMHRLEQAMGWAARKVVPNIGKVERKDGTTRRGVVLGGRTWQPGTIDRTLTGLVGLLWAGTLPGNPRYPVMSIATGIATTGSRFGLFRTTRGMFKQATREGQAAARAAGTYDEFLNIFESDKMRRFSQLMAERGYTFSPFGVMSTGMSEEFIRGMTFHASVDMHMTKLGISSWDEAVELGLANRIAFEGLRSSQEVNHVFGAMGRSPMMSRLLPSRSIATATTQFLSFIPKQTEELLAQMNRNPGYLVEYMALSGMQARIAAQAFGIDISDYTGFGYAPTQPVEDLRSPAIDGVVEFMNWAQAASNNDRRGMQQHGRAVLDTIDNMIPFMVAFEAAGKSAERLTTGKVMSRSGQLNRRLETGDFLEDPSVENFMGALGPEGLRDQDAEFPSVGTDLAPTLFGQQAIRDKLFYKWKAASSDTIDEFLYQAQQRAEELMEAIEDNDVARVDDIAELLRVEHGIYVDPQRMLENKIYSAEISAELRTLTDRAPEAIKKKIYDQIKSHGLRLDK